MDVVDLTLTEEQRQLVDSFAALFTRESSSDRVRAAEPLGFDRQLWEALRGTGVIDMALAEADGGWGAYVTDLALVAEQFGRTVASVPMIEAQVAARILAAAGDGEGLAAALEGRSLVTFAPRQGSGALLPVVPGAAVADTVVVFVDGQLLAVPISGARQKVANLGSMPLADVVVGTDAAVLAEDGDARRLYDEALNLSLIHI